MDPSSLLTATIPNCRKLPGYSPALWENSALRPVGDHLTTWGMGVNALFYLGLNGPELLQRWGSPPPSPACVPGLWQEGSPQRQAASLGIRISGNPGEQPAQVGPVVFCWEWIPAVAEMGVLKGGITQEKRCQTEVGHFIHSLFPLSVHP